MCAPRQRVRGLAGHGVHGRVHAPCELTVMESSKPASAGLPATSGSWKLAYTPANADSVSALPGEIAAARPAMLTCARTPR